ncbi:MAG: ATP-binding cassette domain-containing protein, partial [Wenzhouxiangellaceae bacterium]|nr:ATP-binding cassette domain-containing protein [Wenzhouxiangellaceae bacterium]
GNLETTRNLTIGYFAQHQLEQIDPAISPVANLTRLAGDVPEQKLRDFLGGFAFSGHLATDPCARLSGGERARLVLAMIIWRAPNLLLLDEPTNHLDLEMRHALTVALQGFDGAVVTVSHDRHLLNKTVDDYWLVADGAVRPWRNGLAGYRDWVRQAGNAGKQQAASTAGSRKAERRRKATERERLKPLTDRIRKLTAEIEKMEARKQALAEELADPALYENGQADRLKRLLAEDGQIKSSLEDLEAQWVDAEHQLETLQRAAAD